MMEFISAGVPMVTFPHYGDQLSNSDFIIQHKAGKELFSKKRDSSEFRELATYKDSQFDSKKVKEVFSQLKDDKNCFSNMQRLQTLCRTSGGRNQIVQVVEQRYELGKEHLVDVHCKNRFKGQSWCLSNLFLIAVMCMIVSLTYLSASHYF